MNIALGVTKYVPVSAGHVNKHLFANWFVGTVAGQKMMLLSE